MDIVYIGKILRSHGLKGSVVIRTFADEPRNLKAGATVFVHVDDSDAVQMTVTSVLPYNKNYRVTFKEITDKNQSDQICGHLVGIPRETLAALNKNEFYVADLIGCEVRTKKEKNQWRIADVISNPGNDLLKIISGGNDVLIPFVKDFVTKIDLERREIMIDPPDGLLEGD